jgi:hypothetical protein
MNLHESILLAQKVLEEERVSPTVRYMLREPVVGAFAPAALALAEKGRHPRTVCERPGIHRFTSENFELLAGFYAELADSDKSRFVDVLASRIMDGRAYRNASNDVVGTGSWNHCTSELPLITEFLVRQKQVAALLAALPKAPIRPGLTLLLLQLEEMIALDLTLLSDSDYGTLREAVSSLLPTVDALNQQGRISDTKESNTRYHLVRELPPLCHSIAEMCRKAMFLRLKTARGSEANTEIQSDREQVHSFLEKLRFSRLLVASLEQAERSYREASNAFEYKECMSHLRSFLEDLHKEACVLVHARRGDVLPASWGKAIAYLVKEGVITKSEEEFVTSLYRLVSDTGVHPLVAEREYARLMRNMSIEYGLLFLARLDKWLAIP